MISRIVTIVSSLRPKAFHEFAKFAAVGACNTVTDFAVYIALTRTIPFFSAHLILAASISFVFAVAVSFILNSTWTFRHGVTDWQERYPRFLLVALGGLVINASVLAVLVAFGLHDILAKLVATSASLAWNFPMQRKWTFGK